MRGNEESPCHTTKFAGARHLQGRLAGAKRVLYDVHRAVGFYASALLLAAGVSGASLVFHEAFERGMHRLAGTRPVRVTARAEARAPGATAQPADALLAAAERAQPGGAMTRVLTLLTGLSLPLLAVSGALVWWRRGRREQ